MAIQDYFEFPTAYNPETEQLQADAEFQVYAATDTSFTTQLQVFAADSGVALTPLRSNSIGMLESFRVQGDPTQILLKSGSFVTRVSSKYGMVVEAGLDAATVQAAIAVGPIATSAKNDAVAAKNLAVKAAQDAAAVGATTDAITSGLLRDETTQTYAGTKDLILDFGGSGRFEVVPDPANPGFGLIVAVGSTPLPAQDDPPVIITTSLGPLTVGVPVNVQIEATGEPGAFFISEGALPPGVEMSSTGLVLGNPTSAVNYTLTVTATNAVDADTQELSGSVVAANSAPVITGPESITLTQGVPALAQFTATGPQATYDVTGGNPPAGLALSLAGALSGTPSGTGPYSVTVRATNAFGSSTKQYTGTVVAASSGGAVTPPPTGGGAPVGGNRVASYGPNGSHYPTRTPRVEDTAGWDCDPLVDCTWAAIGQAITTAAAQYPNGKCRIRVKRGTLGGNGAGSTSTPVLQNLGGANRQTRILVVPDEGVFSITHTASARIHNVTGVTFLGFCPWGLGVAEPAAFGVVLTNCVDSAWAWSKTRFANITTTAGVTDGVELIECVAPLQGARDDDRMAFRNGSGGNTYNVLIDGCYIAGTYKASGSSSHCDTLQLSTSGAGVHQNIVLRDTAIFGSTNAAYITTGATTGSLRHTVLLGGFRTALRYPVGADRSQFINGPVAFNGAPADYTASDSTLLVGKVVPVFTSVADSKTAVAAPTPKSGTWTVDAGLFDTVAKIDAAIPFPTDARLQSIWAAV